MRRRLKCLGIEGQFFDSFFSFLVYLPCYFFSTTLVNFFFMFLFIIELTSETYQAGIHVYSLKVVKSTFFFPSFFLSYLKALRSSLASLCEGLSHSLLMRGGTSSKKKQKHENH